MLTFKFVLIAGLALVRGQTVVSESVLHIIYNIYIYIYIYTSQWAKSSKMQTVGVYF